MKHAVEIFSEAKIFETLHRGFEFSSLSHRSFMVLIAKSIFVPLDQGLSITYAWPYRYGGHMGTCPPNILKFI